MQHLGDITGINGAEIPAVDCITGGSPCQDLSIAGKRAGLDGARSGLFREQIRIVREMREQSGCPRFMVWENVPGAFSSNGGADFRTVLEEIVRIAEPDAVIPEPPKGKWDKAGIIEGDGYSIAWRLHDAQYWGVPQRRRRISLVADFGGQCAGEVLFEPEGVSGDSESCGTQGEGTAGETAGSSAGHDGLVGEPESVVGFDNYNSAVTGDTAATLGVNCGMSTGRNQVFHQKERLVAFAANQRDEVRDVGDKATALQAEPVMKQQTFVGVKCLNPQDPQSIRQYETDGSFPALCNRSGKAGQNRQGVVYCIQGDIARGAHLGQNGAGITGDRISYTLGTIDHPAIAFDCRNLRLNQEVSGTLQGKGTGGYSLNYINPVLCRAHGQANAETTDGNCCPSLSCNHEQPIVVLNDLGGQSIHVESGDTAPTLRSESHQHEPVVCYDMTHANDVIRESGEVTPTLKGRMGTGGNNVPITVETFSDVASTLRSGAGAPKHISDMQGRLVGQKQTRWIVRRLTPLECERLQGYPDGWTDIGDWVDSRWKTRKTADSVRYKALGNSIALPFWDWMFKRMAQHLPRNATLGSLFDGIGGFPLCWERIHGTGTALWASEIEEFPIAVTARRFMP